MRKPIKIKIKKKDVKTRRSWGDLNPGTKIFKSMKDYNRASWKRDIQFEE